MWEINSQPAPWLRVSSLKPIRVLDEYDVPRLFTVLTDDQQLLLAYQCAEDRSTARFLLTPADGVLVDEIEFNRIALRDALTKRGWAWIVDRDRSGVTRVQPMAINPRELPDSALPKPGVRLSPAENVLLRVRMIGATLTPGHVPASVVKRTVEGATGAVRALAAHALSLAPSSGRPADEFRRYYDLPAVEFGFHSFEIAFGPPELPASLEFEQNTLAKVQDLLTKGLNWAIDPQSSIHLATPEWSSIIEALTKLTPPQSGSIERVEISGLLAGRRRRPAQLTRATSDRINAARRSFLPDKHSQTHTGFVRELDKDKQTFFLRDARASNICHVSFADDQFNDVALAFESDKLVTVVVYETMPSNELISITFAASEDEVSPEWVGHSCFRIECPQALPMTLSSSKDRRSPPAYLAFIERPRCAQLG